MNDEDARQQVKEDLTTAVTLFSPGESDPEAVRDLVDIVVDNYLQYRGEEMDIDGVEQ